MSTASTPTVRPLVTSGVPRNELTSRARAKARFGSCGSSWTSRKTSGPSARASWTSVDASSSRARRDLRDERCGLGAAADAPPVAEHARLLVDEQDQRPIERQVVDDRRQRRVQQLVEVERRADGLGDLVERDKLREPALELGPRPAKLVGLAGQVPRAGGAARPRRPRRSPRGVPRWRRTGRGRRAAASPGRWPRLPTRAAWRAGPRGRQSSRRRRRSARSAGSATCDAHGSPPDVSAPRGASRSPRRGPGRWPGR